MAGRGSYPHPVIDSADDVSSQFDVINVLVDPTQQDIEIAYEVRTDDPDIQALIDNGLATHSLRWRCSSTISTGELSPREDQRTGAGVRLKAWLDQELVKGDVVAEVRVIAAQEIKGHRWTNQHSDYGHASFDLEPGDVLADAGSFRFNAEKLYDPLDPPIGSCFKFVRSTERRKGIKVLFVGDETVDVQIPAQTFDDFRLLGHRPDLQIALMVLPALVETLDFIRSSKDVEPLDDKAWYVALDALVQENGGWDQSLLELGQKILESPLDTVIRKGIISEEDDG
ncbi:hypothetical protein [Pseudohaliea rubra]|uniref:hypothetical protein n=1 Tax=Pseudohaliea rubra TaxID=475795 RepID=UPI0011870FAC|nr:hypothetical protein [Pseudohaliea rubra]